MILGHFAERCTVTWLMTDVTVFNYIVIITKILNLVNKFHPLKKQNKSQFSGEFTGEVDSSLTRYNTGTLTQKHGRTRTWASIVPWKTKHVPWSESRWDGSRFILLSLRKECILKRSAWKVGVREWGSERMREWANEGVREWGSERMREWENEGVSEWGSERMREWENEGVSCRRDWLEIHLFTTIGFLRQSICVAQLIK